MALSSPIAHRIYDLYGRFYDRFDIFFKKRIARALGALPFRPGDRILDVGIGTGISLGCYPPFTEVVGVDLSRGMLAQAQRKVDRGEVRGDAPAGATRLLQADAMALPFADDSFDVVFCSHVVTTVPNPQRCLTEAFRVTRERGFILIVNHFRSPYPLVSWLETVADPFCRKLGWRSDLGLEDLLGPAGVAGLERASEAPGVVFRVVLMQMRGGVAEVVGMPSFSVEGRLRAAAGA